MIPTPMPTGLADPDVLAALVDYEVTVNDKKWDDGSLQALLAMARLVSFTTPEQRKEDNEIVLKPNDPCRLPGGAGWNNREFFNILISEAQATASPDDQAKLEKWKLFGYPAAENKFSVGELRGLREFNKWLIMEGSPILPRFFNRMVWSLGDLKLLADFGKTHTAQNAVQSSLRNGSEFDKKDKGNFAPYGGPGGGWKDARSAIVEYADMLRVTSDKLYALRDAQKSARSPEAHKDLHKKAASAKLETKSFVAEDAAIDNRTFRWDLEHGDLSEYVRMSDNYDKDTGWIKIPDGLTSSQLEHVERRVSRLVSDPQTTVLAGRMGRSPREVAIFRECYFRSKPRVDAVSNDLVISWNDSWDNLTNGPKLVDLIMTPTSSQRGEMFVRDLDRGVRGFADVRTDLPGKMFDARIVTITAFGVAWGLLMLLSMWLFQESSPGVTFALALITAVAFNAALGHSVNFSPRLFYGLMVALPVLLLVLVLVNNANGARIQQEQDRNYYERNSNSR